MSDPLDLQNWHYLSTEKTPEDNSVVCKRCLSRLHPDDLFLEAAKEYGLH